MKTELENTHKPAIAVDSMLAAEDRNGKCCNQNNLIYSLNEKI